MIHLAAKAVLAPVLLMQAGHVRRTTVELPEPEGPRKGVAGAGRASLSILVAGDSSAAGVGASTQDQALAAQLAGELARRLEGAVRWQLVARTGARSEDVAQMLTQARLRAADAGIVVTGVNDITGQVPLRTALQRRGEIAALMRERAGVRHVLFLAAPPMERFPALPQPLAWVAGADAARSNRAQARWAGLQANVSHVPFEGSMDPALMARDGFHPGPELYEQIARQLSEHFMREVWPRLQHNPSHRRERT